ncbi:hypothetical protein [Agaribacter marinus]|uniref:hypothetical protein n=1 Tax=Agaribacter marinus TaxID=1431249 RepID=UPI0024E13062|nr:hypothetical protein [Agaribacter marinus]
MEVFNLILAIIGFFVTIIGAFLELRGSCKKLGFALVIVGAIVGFIGWTFENIETRKMQESILENQEKLGKAQALLAKEQKKTLCVAEILFSAAEQVSNVDASAYGKGNDGKARRERLVKYLVENKGYLLEEGYTNGPYSTPQNCVEMEQLVIKASKE